MKKTLYLLGILAITTFPLITFASFDTSLKYGSRGDAVSELQDFLTDQNVYTGKVDGKFGLGTFKAVKAFQTANNLDADGYFGKASRAQAQTLLAAELKSSDDAEVAETGTISVPVDTTQPSLDARGCSTASLFSATTGLSCTQNQTSITQDQNLPITPPVIITPPLATQVPQVILNLPKEVSQLELPTIVSANSNSTSIVLHSTGSQRDDIVTITFNNGEVLSKTSTTTSGVSWNFDDLNPDTSYPYTFKIQRGDKYITGSTTAKTDIAFKCNGASLTTDDVCYNYSKEPVRVTKIKSSIYFDTGFPIPATVTCSITPSVIDENTYSKKIDQTLTNPLMIQGMLPIEFPVSILVDSYGTSNNTLEIGHFCDHANAHFINTTFQYEWNIVK